MNWNWRNSWSKWKI